MAVVLWAKEVDAPVDDVRRRRALREDDLEALCDPPGRMKGPEWPQPAGVKLGCGWSKPR